MSSDWLDIYSSTDFVVYLPDMLPLTLRHGERHERLDAFMPRAHPGLRRSANSRPVLSVRIRTTKVSLLHHDEDTLAGNEHISLVHSLQFFQ